MTTPNPPALAQGLLELLLRVDAREAVCGDLLEEYREARVPALGERRASLWYWQQVLGIWLRSYWPFVVPLVALLVINGRVLWGAERRALSGDHRAWRTLRLSAIASLTLWFLTTLGGVALPNIG